MSKSSELDRTVKQYIIECIDPSGYGQNPTSISEKINFLHDTFYAEYGWMVRQKGEQEALAQWFMGLPSACTVEFRNYEILQLAKKWGSLPENPTEKQEDKILDNWFSFIANKTGQLFRGYRVPTYLNAA